MPVYKDEKHGTWFTRYRFKDYTGKLRQTTKRGFRTKREAQEYERKEIDRTGRASDIDFSQLCDAYLADCDARLKRSSYLTIRLYVNYYIRPVFANRKIADISPADIRAWENQLLSAKKKDGKPYSSTALAIITSRLSSLFTFAVKYYGLSRNPMSIAGTVGKRNRRQVFWTLSEFNRFIAAVDDDYYRLAFLLLFYSGMRCGELLALTADDFDFSKNEIHITKAYSSTSSTVTTPKTASSIRNIIMPNSLMQKVKNYLHSFPDMPEYIFHKRSAQGLNYAIRKYAKIAHVPVIRVHDLRHSHASYLINQGVPVTTISKRLGHADSATTLRVYSHMYEDSAQNVAEMLENTLQNT